MYLVLAESRFQDGVQFLTASSLTRARKELPRFAEGSRGYMTLWRPRWATKEDTKKYAREFKEAKLMDFEFKKDQP